MRKSLIVLLSAAIIMTLVAVFISADFLLTMLETPETTEVAISLDGVPAGVVKEAGRLGIFQLESGKVITYRLNDGRYPLLLIAPMAYPDVRAFGMYSDNYRIEAFSIENNAIKIKWRKTFPGLMFGLTFFMWTMVCISWALFRAVRKK